MPFAYTVGLVGGVSLLWKPVGAAQHVIDIIPIKPFQFFSDDNIDKDSLHEDGSPYQVMINTDYVCISVGHQTDHGKYTSFFTRLNGESPQLRELLKQLREDLQHVKAKTGPFADAVWKKCPCCPGSWVDANDDMKPPPFVFRKTGDWDQPQA